MTWKWGTGVNLTILSLLNIVKNKRQNSEILEKLFSNENTEK